MSFIKPKKILIGDDGTIEKPDTFSKVVTTICNITIVILIFMGIMAFVYM